MIIFRVMDEKTDYILLREAVKKYEYYQSVILSRPPILRIKVWCDRMNGKMKFIKSMKALWPHPKGVKIILYFDDKTEYIINAKDNNILANIITKTIKDNTTDNGISNELDQMLNGETI